MEPLRRSAEKVEALKLSAESKLIFLSRKTSSRAQFLERLRAHNVPIHGGRDTIANRYNEFVVRWNANLDAGFPKSKKAVVDAVMAAESDAAKVPKRPRLTSSFFKKMASQESSENDEIPTEGDDFETLVKKTKARIEKKRKLAAEVPQDGKRRCLHSSAHSQKTEPGSQATVTNEPTKSLDNLSRPSARGTVSNSADVREEAIDMRDVSRDGVSSQFDNNSPLVTSRVEPASLAVHSNVCSVDVTSQDLNRDFESNLGPPDQRTRAHSHGANGLPLQAPLWSQTTPEKRIKPTDECRPNSFPTHDAAGIRSSTPTKELGSTSSVQGPESRPESIKAESFIVGRLKARCPSRSPMGNGRGKSKDSPGFAEQSRVHVDVELGMENKGHALRDVCRDNGNPSSTDVTPSKAQLERAERNRLAALERRRKFYELNQLSQMRQPDL